jgi:F0F1-type ATP synthase assembly protein I
VNNKKPELKKDYYALNLSYTMAVGFALFALIGHWLDSKLGGGYKFTLGGLLLGFALGIYEAWKLAQRMNENDLKQKKP